VVSVSRSKPAGAVHVTVTVCSQHCIAPFLLARAYATMSVSVCLWRRCIGALLLI